jgi:hypothetical protein
MRLLFLVLGALLAGCATEANFKAQMNDLVRSQRGRSRRPPGDTAAHLRDSGRFVHPHLRQEQDHPAAGHPIPPSAAAADGRASMVGPR